MEAGRPLADAIAAETARRDLSQQEAADLLGTTQQTVGKWMNARTRPGDPHVPALARYLGMTEDKVREMRGPMRGDPRDRMVLRRQVEALEREQQERSEKLLGALEELAGRVDEIERRLRAQGD